MIELEEVTKVYGGGSQTVHALAGVTERIETGEHVAIMGPSGSGKSTLLHILGCLDRPTAGRYRLFGEDTSQLGPEALARVRRERVGFIFQTFHLVPRLDAAGNVELPMTLAGIERAEREARRAELLKQVGLAGRGHHRPSELSGGERQRVAIARALAMRPSVLLADEPTGNLDTLAGGKVLDLLEELARTGITLVVVTHDPAVARRAARVIVLVDGRVAHRLAGKDMTDLASVLLDSSTGEGRKDR